MTKLYPKRWHGHTPGPWTPSERHPAGVNWDAFIRAPSGDLVATACARGWVRETTEANAALLAGTPTLAEAYVEALAVLEEFAFYECGIACACSDGDVMGRLFDFLDKYATAEEGGK